ncbi:HAD family hydrolase [Acinetobacter soli]|uniref:HAD family hydrolase n=1 Tax=Acinetobacter soli TaxID=487316 RepID=UPI003A8A97FF
MINHTKPSVVTFDVFGTLVKIGEKRSPYKRLMKWMKDNGRKPKSDDAAVIMSHLADFKEIAAIFGMAIPKELYRELLNDLDHDLSSIVLYEDTLSTLEKLKLAGFKLAVCSNLAMPYGKVVYSMLPQLDAYALSYEVGAIKPDESIYQHVIDTLACSADKVLFVGDTPLADFYGPISFGMSARLIDRKVGQTFADILSDLI